ncbi:O49 family O-antigen polymerase, partial [Escherichia coli]
ATGGIGTRNDYGSLYRASGIFNEPAEYSSAITVLVVSSFLINRKLSLLNIIALISTMLSFSFVGIIQSFFVIYIVLFRNLCRKPVYIFLIIGIVILVWISFFDLFIDRYEAFINGSDGSNNTKLDTLNFFLTHTEYLLGGAGLIGYDPETMPLFMQGLYDLTFFGSCISIFGIVIGSFIAIA